MNGEVTLIIFRRSNEGYTYTFGLVIVYVSSHVKSIISLHMIV